MLLFTLIYLYSFGHCSVKVTLLLCFSHAESPVNTLATVSFETQECSSHTPLHTSCNFGTINVFSSEREINVSVFNKKRRLYGQCRLKSFKGARLCDTRHLGRIGGDQMDLSYWCSDCHCLPTAGRFPNDVFPIIWQVFKPTSTDGS